MTRPDRRLAPPSLAVRLFNLTAPHCDAESMLGDLEEEFAERREKSDGRARVWFWQQVVRSAPINLLRRRDESRRRAYPSNRKGDSAMTSLFYDLRFAWRSVTRNKRLAATIIATLALGISTTTVIFSVIDGVVLSPFPFPEPERLVGVGTAMPKLQQDLSFWENLSPAEYTDIRDGSRTLQKVVAWDMGNRQVTEGSDTDNVFSAFWWGDALPTLGLAAELGRGFSADEIKAQSRVAMVSHRFWMNRMGGDPSRVGGPMLINGESYTLVGVLPERALIYGTDLWMPMSIGPDAFPRGRRQFQILARLAPGQSIDDANAELRLIAARTDTAFRAAQPEYEGWRLEAQSFVDINVGFVKPAALILFFAAFFVLAIACVNVASLLLSRAMERTREMAMRMTLGARRSQVARQLVCESVVHALLGGIAGTVLALQGVKAVQLALARLAIPLPGEIAMSPRVLLATLTISLICGFLFGLAPAIHTLRNNTQSALRSEGGAVTGTGRRLRAHRIFVGFQMAFAALLVACSGLLLRSLMQLNHVDSGIAANEILSFRTTLASERFDNDSAKFQQFYETLETNLSALPGVKRAALASQIPPIYFSRSSFLIEGDEVKGEGALKSAYLTSVSPAYFETMGLALRQGRALTHDDRAGAPR